jgi:hypothetical protein
MPLSPRRAVLPPRLSAACCMCCLPLCGGWRAAPLPPPDASVCVARAARDVRHHRASPSRCCVCLAAAAGGDGPAAGLADDSGRRVWSPVLLEREDGRSDVGEADDQCACAAWDAAACALHVRGHGRIAWRCTTLCRSMCVFATRAPHGVPPRCCTWRRGVACEFASPARDTLAATAGCALHIAAVVYPSSCSTPMCVSACVRACVVGTAACSPQTPDRHYRQDGNASATQKQVCVGGSVPLCLSLLFPTLAAWCCVRRCRVRVFVCSLPHLHGTRAVSQLAQWLCSHFPLPCRRFLVLLRSLRQSSRCWCACGSQARYFTGTRRAT